MNPELCPLNKMQHIFFSRSELEKSRPVYKKIRHIFVPHQLYICSFPTRTLFQSPFALSLFLA